MTDKPEAGSYRREELAQMSARLEQLDAQLKGLPVTVSETRVNELIDQKIKSLTDSSTAQTQQISGVNAEITSLQESVSRLKVEAADALTKLTALATALNAQTSLTENQVKDLATKAVNDSKEVVKRDDIKDVVKTKDLTGLINQDKLKKHVGWRVWLAYGIGSVAGLIAIFALIVGPMFPRPSSRGSGSATGTSQIDESALQNLKIIHVEAKE